jgi:hypothetical protein
MYSVCGRSTDDELTGVCADQRKVCGLKGKSGVHGGVSQVTRDSARSELLAVLYDRAAIGQQESRAGLGWCSKSVIAS